MTGRFELPEELLDLERSGLLEAAAFDRSRARRAVPTAPSPPHDRQDPLRTTSAQGEYSLYDETSRCTCVGVFVCCAPCCACKLLFDSMPVFCACLHSVMLHGYAASTGAAK